MVWSWMCGCNKTMKVTDIADSVKSRIVLMHVFNTKQKHKELSNIRLLETQGESLVFINARHK